MDDQRDVYLFPCTLTEPHTGGQVWSVRWKGACPRWLLLVASCYGQGGCSGTEPTPDPFQPTRRPGVQPTERHPSLHEQNAGRWVRLDQGLPKRHAHRCPIELDEPAARRLLGSSAVPENWADIVGEPSVFAYGAQPSPAKTEGHEQVQASLRGATANAAILELHTRRGGEHRALATLVVPRFGELDRNFDIESRLASARRIVRAHDGVSLGEHQRDVYDTLGPPDQVGRGPGPWARKRHSTHRPERWYYQRRRLRIDFNDSGNLETILPLAMDDVPPDGLEPWGRRPAPERLRLGHPHTKASRCTWHVSFRPPGEPME